MLPVLSEPLHHVLWSIHKPLLSMGLQSWCWTLTLFALLWRGVDLLVYLPYYNASLKAKAGLEQPRKGQLTTGVPPQLLLVVILLVRLAIVGGLLLVFDESTSMAREILIPGWLPSLKQGDRFFVLPILTGFVWLLSNKEEFVQESHSDTRRQLPVVRLLLWIVALVSLFLLPSGLVWCLLVFGLVNVGLAYARFWALWEQKVLSSSPKPPSFEVEQE